MPHSILAMMDEAEFEDLLTIVAIEEATSGWETSKRYHRLRSERPFPCLESPEADDRTSLCGKDRSLVRFSGDREMKSCVSLILPATLFYLCRFDNIDRVGNPRKTDVGKTMDHSGKQRFLTIANFQVANGV